MFDVDGLVADCQRALVESEPRRAIREVLTRVVSDPGPVTDALASATGGLQMLHNSATLTVLNVIWAPHMHLYPHDHRMWAAIGIYSGVEDNAFYRRVPGTITPAGGKELRTGDVLLLGDDAIHAVTNPARQFTGAIHVYGGDFVNEPRSQWDPDTLREEPYDLDQVIRQFQAGTAAAAERDAAPVTVTVTDPD